MPVHENVEHDEESPQDAEAPEHDRADILDFSPAEQDLRHRVDALIGNGVQVVRLFGGTAEETAGLVAGFRRVIAHGWTPVTMAAA